MDKLLEIMDAQLAAGGKKWTWAKRGRTEERSYQKPWEMKSRSRSLLEKNASDDGGVDASTELVVEPDVKHGSSPELGSERGSHGFARGT